MHPIDEFATPLLVLGAIALGIAFGIWGALATYRRHVAEGQSFCENLEPLRWTVEQELAWRDYFSEKRADPSTDLR